MSIFATIIHALSAIAFLVIGLIVLFNDGTIATNDVTITLALLGFNVMIRYIVTTGGEQAAATSEDAGRDPRQMGAELRTNARQRSGHEAASPERPTTTPQESAAQEITDASEHIAQLIAEAERNRARRD